MLIHILALAGIPATGSGLLLHVNFYLCVNLNAVYQVPAGMCDMFIFIMNRHEWIDFNKIDIATKLPVSPLSNRIAATPPTFTAAGQPHTAQHFEMGMRDTY